MGKCRLGLVELDRKVKIKDWRLENGKQTKSGSNNRNK